MASLSCQALLNSPIKPVTVTQTKTGTAKLTTFTPPPVDQTTTTVITETVTSGTTCVDPINTVTLPAATVVNYPTRGAGGAKRSVEESSDLVERGIPGLPDFFLTGCKNQPALEAIKNACRCFLKTLPTPTQTVTRTVSVYPTTTLPPLTRTSITTSKTTTTLTSCTSTVTQTIGGYPQSCGIPFPSKPSAAASGSIVCPNVAPPSETNARFRIEGGSQGTIYEDCISSGPRKITTPSGGTHLCDGTNNNANPSPGATFTTQIDAAGNQKGFDFDGTYSSSFSDFFITRIAETSQTSTAFWGLLRNLQFTSSGGCQEYSTNGPEGLWAFDAFSKSSFLKLDPEYMVVAAGSAATVTVNVRQTDGNGGALSPASGASVNGATSDASGNVQLPVPLLPGCYQYKAEKSGSLRSNAFYLTVVSSFT